MTFNQQKYIQEYNKKHYKEFRVNMKIEEMQELEELLSKVKITKAQFLKKAIEDLKKLSHNSH